MARRKKDEQLDGCGYGCLIIIAIGFVGIIVNFIIQNAYVFIGLLIGLVVLILVVALVVGYLEKSKNSGF